MIDYSITNRYYNTNDTINLGTVLPYDSPDVLIDFMERWTRDIDRLLILEEGYSERYMELIQERGVTYDEYLMLFSSVADYDEHIVFEFLLIDDRQKQEYYTIKYNSTRESYAVFLEDQSIPAISFFFENIGTRIHPFTLIDSHTYCLAKTRAGKSELIKATVALVAKWYKLKKKAYNHSMPSIVVIDPHGDLAKELRRLKVINDNLDDLIYIEPNLNGTHTPVFNPFQLDDKTPANITTSTENLIEALDEMLSDHTITGNMKHVLRPCIYTLIANEGTYFNDLLDMLQALNMYKKLRGGERLEPRFQKYINMGLAVDEQYVNDFFKLGYQDIHASSIVASISKLRGLLMHQATRHFIQGDSTFNLEDALNTGKIVIFNINHSILDKTGMMAVGRLLLSEIKNITRRRQPLPKELRPRTWCIIDECQNFMDNSEVIEDSLSQLGKYNTRLYLSHQYVGQIDEKMVKSAMANTSIKFIGNNSSDTMSTFSKDINVETKKLLQTKKYHFYCRVSDKDAVHFKTSDKYLTSKKKRYISEQEAVEYVDKYMQSRYYKSIMIEKGSVASVDNTPTTATPFEAKNDQVTKDMLDFYGEVVEWEDTIDFTTEIKPIGSRKQRTIEALGRFKFLTVSQLARLGIGKARGNFSNMLRELIDTNKKKPLVAEITTDNRNEEKVYCLTPEGKKVVAGDLDTEIENIKAPRSIPTSQSKKLKGHDRYAIDCHIELYETCAKYGIEIRQHDNDFDTVGSVRNANDLERLTRLKTTSSYLEPDAIFKLATPKGMLMYLFEMECRDNRNHKDLIVKIDKYVEVLNIHAVKEKYDFHLSPRVLFVFLEESTMQYVLKHLKENISNAGFWFLCKLYDDVVPSKDVDNGVFSFSDPKNFFKDWTTTSGSTDMF